RTGTMLVRQFDDDTQPLSVVLDGRRSAYPDAVDFESTVDVAAGALCAAVAAGVPAWLRASGRPVLRATSRLAVLDALAAVEFGADDDARLAARVAGAGPLLLLTGPGPAPLPPLAAGQVALRCAHTEASAGQVVFRGAETEAAAGPEAGGR